MTVTKPPLRTAIDLDGITLDAFEGRPVAVLGLARSGLALARFLLEQGAIVTIYDGREAADLGPDVTALAADGAQLRLGSSVDPAEALVGQALITSSPSINSRFPTTEPRLRAALAAVEAEGRIPVVSEVDLFLRLCPGRTVGITGTKGKTTTSSLVAAILERGAGPVMLGGNIGRPLIDQVAGLGPEHTVVLELSELQLPTLSRGTDVAVYTHVTSDHIDRHGSLEAYRAVKRRLAELLPPDGALVRNEDDEVVSTYRATSGAREVGYSRLGSVDGGVGVRDGWLVAGGVAALRDAGVGDGPIMPLEEIPLPGEHSVSNVAAAIAVGLLHGIDPAAIREAVIGFGGVEHRLETVATIDGVRYVNDSQGTQPDAVIAAVRSFEKPLVLIAGGRAKGNPIDALAAAVGERVSAVVLIGESAAELGAAFSAAGLDTIEAAASMADAVERATALARQLAAATPAATPAAATATVLLSPAAASFDMFVDYEARGSAFKAAVHELARGERR